MRLKSIEIKGFKSFGDKVTIHFNDGVTGIVGPNGCGKSNVVDAMRWVLGEQKSRMLRSEKMENVLFNGTKNRKQAHLAEVSLSFENSKNILPTAFNEVTITRKLYRSGESEYQLNGVNCRLKDITSLFLDTGIGSDSYAIMELKMIDDILNDKENSRRLLFEEASGVSKYKMRKKETLSKLQDTENDLNRVDDILFEIDKNLRMLQAQAKKTERYYKMREEYKSLSLDFAYFSLNGYRDQLQRLEEQIQAVRDQKQSLETKNQQAEAKIQAVKLQIVEREKLLSSRQKATQDFIAGIRQYENEQRIQNERHKHLTDKEARLQKQIKEDTEHLKYIQVELEKLQLQLNQANETVEAKTQEVEALKLKLENTRGAHKQKQQLLQASQQKLQLERNEVHRLEKEVAVYRIQIESITQELKRNEQDLDEKTTEFDGFSQGLEALDAKNTRLQAELMQLKEAEAQLQNQLQQVLGLIEQSKSRANELNRQSDRVSNEYQLTKSLVDNLEGYPDSLKFLKKAPSWSKNAQLLSDILTVKPEFKAIIENYLEPFLNHYVVDTFAEAKAGIDLLGDSGKGRAHFFVLEAFEQYKQPQPRMLADCVEALSIAECDVPYHHLINHLLGNVFLVQNDDFEGVVARHRQADPTAVFISKSGRYTGNGRQLAGGSLGLFEGKRIGRKRNLELLQKQLANLELQGKEERDLLIKLQRQEQSLRNASKATEIESLQGEASKTDRELALLRSQYDQHKKFLDANKNRSSELSLKLKESVYLLGLNQPLLENTLKALEKTQIENSALQASFEKLNEDLQKQSAAFNQSNILYHQEFNRLSGFKKDEEFKLSQLQVLNNRLRENGELVVSVQAEIKGLVSGHEINDTQLLEMYEQKERMEAAVQEAEIDYLKERGALEEIELQVREDRKEKELTEALLQQLLTSIGEVRLQENGLCERLSVEFEVDASEIRARTHAPQTAEGVLKKQLEDVKSRLENFGPINPMAIEAFQEIETRHQFISSQKNDLLQAKNALLQTISQIDETAREKFMSAFEAIRENFIVVFRSLFTEQDACDLILVDAKNPLESAINIIAKPKGKKPLTINQLSGGEKTLTATALLFSIYLYKPAPFCIFDEVDAPLDDQNIDKFNRLIRKFSDHSQFIIVTHNKKTMETTDVIYGVTMVEQGVSRVVPVDFRGLVLN